MNLPWEKFCTCDAQLISLLDDIIAFCKITFLFLLNVALAQKKAVSVYKCCKDYTASYWFTATYITREESKCVKYIFKMLFWGAIFK